MKWWGLVSGRWSTPRCLRAQRTTASGWRRSWHGRGTFWGRLETTAPAHSAPCVRLLAYRGLPGAVARLHSRRARSSRRR
jgi:hypothetical protein